MPLPNIHLKKGKYPQSGKELKHFRTISDIIYHISQLYADKPNNNTNMLWGYKPCAYY